MTPLEAKAREPARELADSILLVANIAQDSLNYVAAVEAAYQGIIAAKREGLEMAACMCMGPQNGEPLCPCQMRAAMTHMSKLPIIPAQVLQPIETASSDNTSYYNWDGVERRAGERRRK